MSDASKQRETRRSRRGEAKPGSKVVEWLVSELQQCGSVQHRTLVPLLALLAFPPTSRARRDKQLTNV